VSQAAILSHGYIPHFRVRLYQLLAERGEVDYVVFHGAPPSWIGVPELPGPFAFAQRRVVNHEFRVGPASLVYQPVLREILTGGYDAVVLTMEAKFVANLLLALFGKLLGIRVLFWGFGFHPVRGFRDSDRPHPLARLANLVKDLAVKYLADGYLAYTAGGHDKLVAAGFPRERAFVLQNTIDIGEQIRLHHSVAAEDDAEIRGRLGLRPDSIVFAHIGRLVQFKRVDLLIEAVRRINDERRARRPVEALIIGSGPVEDALRTQAAGIPGIHFLGALPPDERVARCLKVSAAAVIGGLVGLVVNHALAHGRPVITRASVGHSPELEYVIDGDNGLIVPGDVAAFAAALGRFADCPESQARLAAGALRSREALGLETMADNFDAAVRATIARGKARRRARPMAAPLGGE
jgi:glycosyltransferase involved in cell wall biosynthesis